MSDLPDQGIAGAIGAGIVGAAVALKRIFTKGPVPEQLPPSSLAVRVGRLYEQHETLRQEFTIMRHDIAAKLDRIEESVDELRIARARTDEISEGIRSQLADIRQDLRDSRRNKE